MKFPIAIICLSLFSTGLIAKSIDTNSKDQTTKMPANASNVEKISYALGYEVAQQTPPELDMNSFIKGVREGHAQEKPAYTEEELQKAFEEFQQEIPEAQKIYKLRSKTVELPFLIKANNYNKIIILKKRKNKVCVLSHLFVA